MAANIGIVTNQITMACPRVRNVSTPLAIRLPESPTASPVVKF
jgi:hypothetical protein